jgi:hypothetical protein
MVGFRIGFLSSAVINHPAEKSPLREHEVQHSSDQGE